MSDVFTKEKRSEIMSRVRGKGNKATELKLIALFREHGFKRWRRNYPLFGKPDFVFPADRVVIFVDGEFWHGHPTRAKIPEENREFWEAKINRNIARDRLVNRTLKGKGWTVVRIWQYQLGTGSWKRKVTAAIRLRRVRRP
jgi:DNA mismatch endonuclease (patch repair protein)